METKHVKHIIPHKLLEYIDQHFAGGKLADIKEEKISGHSLFKVDVAQGKNVHHLEFNEKGNMLKDEEEALFERARHQDFFRDQGFYEKN